MCAYGGCFCAMRRKRSEHPPVAPPSPPLYDCPSSVPQHSAISSDCRTTTCRFRHSASWPASDTRPARRDHSVSQPAVGKGDDPKARKRGQRAEPENKMKAGYLSFYGATRNGKEAGAGASEGRAFRDVRVECVCVCVPARDTRFFLCCTYASRGTNVEAVPLRNKMDK